MDVEVSPSSVADAPDNSRKDYTITCGTAKPLVIPLNSALIAYKARLEKKRSLAESSGAVSGESAMKHRAVEPIGTSTTAASVRVSSFVSPTRALTPWPASSTMREEFIPAIDDCEDCLKYQSKQGCTNTKCTYRHIDPEIGSQAWYNLRRDIRITNTNVTCNLTPRLYLGLKRFTLLDEERETLTVEVGRTIVDYCYRSYFTLGCPTGGNNDACIRCHELPVEGCREWELLMVGLARVAQRNRVNIRNLDFSDCIKARGLTIAAALSKDLSSFPLPVASNDPCIYYYSTHGCWSPSCCHTHARPEVGTTEWKRLREVIEHAVSLPHNTKFDQFVPIGYLGMTDKFKTQAGGSGHWNQRKRVAYCLPSFSTAGCNVCKCNRCHDLPVESSDEWAYLRDALLMDVSQRRLVDDPAFDVLPVI